MRRLINGVERMATTIRRRLLWTFVVALMGVSAAPAPTHAQAQVFQIHREDAFAEFRISDGCLLTLIQVHTGNSFTQQPSGPPVSGTSASAQIFVLDLCTSTLLVAASNTTDVPTGSFVVSGNLNTAELHTTFDLFDGAGEPSPVTIDLAWTGIGDITNDTGNGGTHIPHECVTNGHVSISSRNADVTGMLSFAGTTYDLASPVNAQLSSEHDSFSIAQGCNE
jgi:hypothetical protein